MKPPFSLSPRVACSKKRCTMTRSIPQKISKQSDLRVVTHAQRIQRKTLFWKELSPTSSRLFSDWALKTCADFSSACSLSISNKWLFFRVSISLWWFLSTTASCFCSSCAEDSLKERACWNGKYTATRGRNERAWEEEMKGNSSVAAYTKEVYRMWMWECAWMRIEWESVQNRSQCHHFKQ